MATKSAEQQQTDAQQNAQISDLQQQQDTQQQAAQPAPPPQAPPPPQAAAPAPSTGLTDDSIAQLKQLGELHESGVLTDAEFEVAKQKILGN
jgi:hemolysin activation/secretion protein